MFRKTRGGFGRAVFEIAPAVLRIERGSLRIPFFKTLLERGVTLVEIFLERKIHGARIDRGFGRNGNRGLNALRRKSRRERPQRERK